MAPEGKRGGKAYEGGGGGGGGGTLYLGLASLLSSSSLLVVWTLAAAASLSRKREEGTNDNSSLNCRRVHCLTKVGEAPLLLPSILQKGTFFFLLRGWEEERKDLFSHAQGGPRGRRSYSFSHIDYARNTYDFTEIS